MVLRLPSALLSLVVFGAACATDRQSPLSPSTPPPGQAALCTFTLSLDRTSFIGDGGSARATIKSSAPLCGWEITLPSWVETQSNVGAGDATVFLVIKPAQAESRAGEVSVGTARVAISQDARDPLVQWVRCHTAAKTGVYNSGVCTVQARHTEVERITADLTVFGGKADAQVYYVTASGGQYDLDLRVPADFPSGPVPVAFTAHARDGRTSTVTASLDVVKQ